MKDLYFFTASFPFGKKETYIETEIEILSKYFSYIHIFPFFYSEKDKNKRGLPENVIVENPVIPLSRFKRIFFAFRSLAPIGELIKEFFRQKLYLSLKKTLNWCLTTVDFCVTISSEEFRNLQKADQGIFYFYWGTGWANVLPYVRKKKEIKYFTRLHGGEVYLERAEGHVPLRKKIFDSSDFLLVISDNLKDYLQSIFNIENHKIILSRLGCSYYGTNPASKDNIIRIVTCSNVILIKRLHLMVDILTKIGEEQIEWHHFGDGPELPAIQEKSGSLGQNILPVFHGRVANMELLAFYNSVPVDVFVNLSQHEGIPVSIMEAMSFSVPCIATDAGATREIVDNDCGYLIDIDYDIEFVKAIILSVKSEKFLAKRNKSFLKWDNNYNSSKNYSRLCEILLNV